MPPADARRMMSKDRLPLRVTVKEDGGLDVLATRSEDGQDLALTVVNVADRPVEAIVTITSVGERAFVLNGSLLASNSPSSPKAISSRWLRTTIGPEGIGLTLPAQSVVSLRLTQRTASPVKARRDVR